MLTLHLPILTLISQLCSDKVVPLDIAIEKHQYQSQHQHITHYNIDQDHHPIHKFNNGVCV